jgi:hypothetical protein
MAVSLPEGQWSDELVALAATVRKDWLGIDTVWERLRGRYGFHLQRSTGLAEDEFLLEALYVAKGNHVLRAFATGLMQAGLTEDGFDERLLAVVGTTAYTLQAFQDGAFRPTNALLAAKGMLQACEHVCRIEVAGSHAGTGVLVRPRLVATAAHVVWDLVVPQPDGTVHAREGSLRQLAVVFGDVEDYLPASTETKRNGGVAAELHPDWLAWGSQPTPNELSRATFEVRDIAGITEPDGPWDLVLIRLAAPRPQSAPATLTAAPHAQPFQIHVLHHPARPSGYAEPLLWSIGSLDEQLGTPAVRALHNANTLGGSSGAPVFDREWRIVALHQGGARDLQRHTDAAALGTTARNRAVPVGCWSAKLDEIERLTDEVPYLRFPVIGRRVTQQRIWRAMRPAAAPAERLLIVRGEPGTGLRFTKRLVRKLVLPHSNAVATALDVTNALQDDADEFAHRLVAALSSKLAPAGPLGTSTTQNHVRTTVAPSLGAKLEELAGGRPIWLVLEGCDTTVGTEQSGLNNLLLTLVLHLAEYTSLRLVLVGWQQTPPEEFVTSVEDLVPPGPEDIVRACLPPAEQPTPVLVAMAWQLLDLERERGHVGYPAARRVIQSLMPALGAELGTGGAG